MPESAMGESSSSVRPSREAVLGRPGGSMDSCRPTLGVTRRRCRAGGVRSLGCWMTNGRWSRAGRRRSPRRSHGAAGQESRRTTSARPRYTGWLCWSRWYSMGPRRGRGHCRGFNLVHVGKPLVPLTPACDRACSRVSRSRELDGALTERLSPTSADAGVAGRTACRR